MFIAKNMCYLNNNGKYLDCWIIKAIPKNHEDGALVLYTRIKIAKYVGMPTQELTIKLRDEYNCITNIDVKNYTFFNEVDCEMACKYLDSLLVAKLLYK